MKISEGIEHFYNYPEIFGKNQRCRGDALDRQTTWIIQPVAGSNTHVLIRLYSRIQFLYKLRIVLVSIKHLGNE